MRHFAISLVLSAMFVSTPAAQEKKNEAEELFKKLEEKLLKAKSFQASYKSTIAGLDGESTGSLTTAEGNKLHFKIEAKVKSVTRAFELISDGKKMLIVDEGRNSPEYALAKASETWVLFFLRSGINGAMMAGLPDRKAVDDSRKETPLTGFSMGPKEKIDGKDAVCILYTLTVENGGALNHKLWLDATTHLPLKREFTGKEKDKTFTCTETYSKPSVDEKIDPKVFEVP